MFCRCDNPEITARLDGLCAACQMPEREVSTDLLHKPPTITTFAPPRVIVEKVAWRVCPDCAAENTEHKPRCPRASWNVDRYCGGLRSM